MWIRRTDRWIQVLRLVYYEMFSRFYKGSGREFKPYTGTAKN